MTMCQKISVKEFKQLNKDFKVKLIDIRSKQENARENITSAQCIPTEELTIDKFDKDDIVVFHCQTGTRTQQAEGIFKNLGINKVYILDGGLNAWKKDGQQTQVDTKAPLPIMRQVQIIVGFMVVLGVILALTISPYFSLLSAFFGAGLLFAGLSGFCGLAKVLMLLPYNKTK